MRDEEVFYTDKQLKARWHCSHMKLYRLRQKGELTSIRVGWLWSLSNPCRRCHEIGGSAQGSGLVSA